LHALLNQDSDVRYEIIVVDSSPEDKTKDIVSGFPEVKFIELRDKAYPGIARNAGAEQARGEVIIFVDSDIIVSRYFVENAVKYYKERHNIFTGSLDLWSGKGLNLLGKIELFFEFSEFKPKMRKGERWCLPSAVLAIKRQLFNENRFLSMETSEDVELTVRLRKKGYALYFNPELKVFHNTTATFNKLIEKAFQFGITNMQIRRIHVVSGSYFVRNALSGFFAVQIFGLVKLAKMSWRNIRYNEPLDKLIYIIFLPFMLLLILSWMFGFYKELFFYSRQKERRT
jgi:cellulose synthase/poly-beta-1,6-N-acetylglucosamine synthase-like glycosyltransferase